MDNEKIANVIQIQIATPPLKPVSPKVFLTLLLGISFGAFGGVIFAFLMEHMDDRLEKPEEAEDLLNIPVLASIPDIKA